MKLKKCNHTYHVSEEPRSNSARKPLMREKTDKKETKKSDPNQALAKKIQETGAAKPQKQRKNETRKKKEKKEKAFPPSPPQPIPFSSAMLPRANQPFGQSWEPSVLAMLPSLLLVGRVPS